MPLILENPRCLLNKFRSLFLALLLLNFCSQTVYAADNMALITRGVARTLFSAFQIPKEILVNAPNAFPLGIVAGTMNGAMKTVVGTIMGAGDIARGAAPYAKYAVFAL
jgi:hypothetical protein